MDYPTNPSFDFIDCKGEREMLKNAYNTITKLNKWDFIRNYIPNEKKGFTFDNNSQIVEIMNVINDNYTLHSGCSLGCTMRVMHKISLYGYEKFKEMYMNDADY